ncbi:MAG: DNA polymerase I [Rhodospirillaceae bacterium]|nr:DNA polymerase I [Rhodospirillaceae bacterium]
MAAKTSPTRRRLYLIDGSGYIFRAFHALPPMTRPDGTPVNAVYGFSNMLMKLLDDLRDHSVEELIAVVFDAKRLTFRNEIYKEYKAHRPEAPEELVPQFSIIRDATRAFNVCCLEMEGFEADDLIATYAKIAQADGIDVVVISADKDLMQLIRPGVTMLDPMKNRTIGPDQVMEKFGVLPDKVIEVQALAGDSSDNVPGVPGIGVKTAAELINQYGDLETLLSKAGEIKQPKRRENLLANAELARISKRLVTLKDDVPVDVPMEKLKWIEPDPDTLINFIAAQGFKSLMAKVHNKLGGTAHSLAPIPQPDEGAEKKSAPAKPAHNIPAPITGRGAYETVQTVADLERWAKAAAANGWVAVDTETTGLDPLRAKMCGVSLSITPGTGCYIPVRHVGSAPQGTLDLGGDTDFKGGSKDAPPQIPLKDAIRILKPLLEDPSVLKIGHNIKYDMHVFAREGIHMAPVEDTIVISYILEGANHGHGMDELAQLHLDHQTIKFADVCGSGKNQITFDRVALDKATEYAAEDADITRRLHALLKPRLREEKLLTIYETMDRPLIYVLKDMEAAGILVDKKVLAGLSQDFAGRMAVLETEIHKLAGEPFNVNSPKQLGEILFERMSLPGGKKGKTGAYATGAEVLDELAAQGHDLPARVLDYRQLAKLKSTYTDALMGEINPDTGRVHTSFAQTIASTGRLSSIDPNLQNIPIRTEDGRKIRTAFTAPKGKKLLSADYSQIELRLVAHVADVKALKRAFKDGEDIHAATASEMFGVPIRGMDPMIRRRAKAINFGIIYGISGFGLARQLGIPRGEAQEYINTYFAKFPELRDYMEETKAIARKQGYVTTLFGRRCYIPGIGDKNPNMRGFAERAAINAPIQGGAADIIKRAMIRLPGALADAGLKACMLLQVHDELVFEVADAEVKKTSELVKRVMEGAAQLDVPLTVDVGVGLSWADAH